MLHTPLFELYRRLPYLGDTMKKETKAMLEMLAAAALWSIAGIIMKFIPWNFRRVCVYLLYLRKQAHHGGKRDSAAIHLAGVYRDIHGAYI